MLRWRIQLNLVYGRWIRTSMSHQSEIFLLLDILVILVDGEKDKEPEWICLEKTNKLTTHLILALTCFLFFSRQIHSGSLSFSSSTSTTFRFRLLVLILTAWFCWGRACGSSSPSGGRFSWCYPGNFALVPRLLRLCPWIQADLDNRCRHHRQAFPFPVSSRQLRPFFRQNGRHCICTGSRPFPRRTVYGNRRQTRNELL